MLRSPQFLKRNWRALRWILVLAPLVFAGFGCKGLSSQQLSAIKPVTLEYWGVFESPDAIEKTIQKYRQLHPNITINYRKFRLEEYEKELVNALAEDRGPDIFSVEADWVRAYANKASPMPQSVKIANIIKKGGGNDQFGIRAQNVEVEVSVETKKMPTIKQIKELFVSAVGDDVIFPDSEGKEKIWGLPLSFDALAMFYNRNLLDRNGVSEPPKRWDVFVETIKKLRRIDSGTGLMTVAAAGLGAGLNIERAPDILAMLMLQNGAQMYDEDSDPSFQLATESSKDRSVLPGAEALEFYTDFANPLNDKVYGWDRGLPGSFEMFASGNLAFFFGYSYHRDLLLMRSPKLNYAIASVPQLNDQPVNVANYWVSLVSKKTSRQDEAWDFVIFASMDKDAVLDYLKIAQRPTALRSLINTQKESQEELAQFIDSVLSTKTWYQGKNKSAAEKIFVNMIEAVGKARMEGARVNYVKLVNDAALQIGSVR